MTVAHWVAAVLYNGLGRYEEAIWRRLGKPASTSTCISRWWALPELIEAAARTGNPRIAGDALDLLAEATRAGGTDLGIGIEARSRALLRGGEAAEGQVSGGDRPTRPCPAASSSLPAPTCCTASGCAASAAGREARDQPRTAFAVFDAMGMEAFAGRARSELRATGERARLRGPGASEVLTAQEEQVARLVAEHLSNREIAARLFISASTVEYHLRKIFRKLGVSNRAQLARTLRNDKGTPAQQD